MSTNQERLDLPMTLDEIVNLALVDAAYAIDIARTSGMQAVVFITGNSYMPPLRDFGSAESVYQIETEDGDEWSLYYETFEAELDKNDVYLGCPDYDNALYVVDTARFQYREDADDSETLSGEWEAI